MFFDADGDDAGLDCIKATLGEQSTPSPPFVVWCRFILMGVARGINVLLVDGKLTVLGLVGAQHTL